MKYEKIEKNIEFNNETIKLWLRYEQNGCKNIKRSSKRSVKYFIMLKYRLGFQTMQKKKIILQMGRWR